jgi:hypothetical protein
MTESGVSDESHRFTDSTDPLLYEGLEFHALTRFSSGPGGRFVDLHPVRRMHSKLPVNNTLRLRTPKKPVVGFAFI